MPRVSFHPHSALCVDEYEPLITNIQRHILIHGPHIVDDVICRRPEQSERRLVGDLVHAKTEVTGPLQAQHPENPSVIPMVRSAVSVP